MNDKKSVPDNIWIDPKNKKKSDNLNGPLRFISRLLLGDFLSVFMDYASKIIKKGDVLLDVGTGSGYVSIRVAKKFDIEKIICLDQSEIMLDLLKQNAKKNKVINKIDFLSSDANNIKINENSIDLAFSNFVFHELQYPELVLSKIVKSLKPGAWFIITDFRDGYFGKSIEKHHSANIHGVFSLDSLYNLLLSVNLTDIKIKKIRQCVFGMGRKRK